MKLSLNKTIYKMLKFLHLMKGQYWLFKTFSELYKNNEIYYYHLRWLML